MEIVQGFMHFIIWFCEYKIPFAGYYFSLADFIIWGGLAGISLFVIHFFMSD